MSRSSSEADATELLMNDSPPTSPSAQQHQFSPPTSPHQRHVSPPTSPLICQDSTDDSSTSSSPKRKRRKTGLRVSRTTAVRWRTDEDDESSTDEANNYVLINELTDITSIQDAGEGANDCEVPATISSCSSDSESSGSRSTSSDSDNGSESDSSARSGVGNQSDDNNQYHSSDTDEGNAPLYEDSETSVNEAILDVMRLYLKGKWTKKSLDGCARVIKKHLPTPNNFPSSGKNILEKVEELISTYKEIVYTVCAKCSELLDNGSEKCVKEECGCTEVNKFYSLPIKEQIKHLFEQRNLAAVIDYNFTSRKKKEGYICDILDGSAYLSVKQNLTGKYDTVFVLNSDGVPLSDSSNREMWLVMGTICEVPLRLRPSFMVIFGVYVGTKKPNMNVYLRPVVDQISDLCNVGVTWVHPETKETMISTGTAPCLSVDTPARAEMLCQGDHNSRFGCNVCEQKTKKVELTHEEIMYNQTVDNPRKKKKRKRRFLFQDDLDPANLRSGQRMALQSEAAEERGRPRKGVKGKTVMTDIPYFDRALCVCAEYLHLICLGVVKYLLLKIFFDKTGEWYIGDFTDIDDMISNIRVPDFVKRLPRGIRDIKHWKGSEFRNFLLFYSLPIFKGRLPEKYFQLWLLLVGAVYNLLKDEISSIDLRSAELMLREFVRNVGKLYGENCYTFNVHTLLHLSELVKRWGPLYSTAAFCFESLNGLISALIHGTKHFGQELCNNLRIIHGVAVLENIVNSGPKDFLMESNASFLVLGRAWSENVLSNADRLEISKLKPEYTNFVVYNRVKVRSIIYSCYFYDKTKKRCNSYVQYGQSEYGQIVAFLKFDDSISVFCYLRKIKITHLDLFFHTASRFVINSLLPFEVEKENVCIIPVEELSLKLLKVDQYLALSPNSYEINL